MPLTPFCEPGGEIDYNAAFEQMSFCTASYENDMSVLVDAIRAIGLDANIIDQQNAPADWTLQTTTLPRYVAFSHAGQYWVVIQGTYTTYQWSLNVFGVLLDGIIDGTTCLGQGNWVGMSRGMYARLRPLIPTGIGTTVNISGHSLGGVVGTYLGMMLASLSTGNNVRIMTFGAPRGIKGTCAFPDRVSCVANIQTLDDIVTHLPPGGLLQSAWSQPGQINVIRADGTLADDDYNSGSISLTPWDTSRFEQHFPRTYQGAMAARYASLLPQPPPPQPKALADVIGLTPGIPCADTVQACPVFSPGSIGMANLKIQLFCNWGSKGFSEVYYRTGTVDSIATVDAIARLVGVRAGLLVGPNVVPPGDPPAELGPQFVFYRISDLAAPNASVPKGFSDVVKSLNSGNIRGDRRNYPYATGISAALTKRIFKFKGAPREWMHGDASVRYGPIKSQMAAPFALFVNEILTGGWGSLVTTASVQNNITAASIDDDGHLLITTVGVFAPNAKIKIKGMRGSGTRGLNGNTRVIEVLTGNQYRLAKKKRDTCTFDPSNKGTAQAVVQTISPIASLTFTGWSAGDLGNAFTGERGRRACCRS